METFAFSFDRTAAPFLRAMNVTPENTSVKVDDTHLTVEFGKWGFTTPLTNISCIEITRNYLWVKAIGLRGSIADGGVTFGTSTAGGVCVMFHEPIPRVLPVGPARHPGATMTVSDLDGLAHLLRTRCLLT